MKIKVEFDLGSGPTKNLCRSVRGGDCNFLDCSHHHFICKLFRKGWTSDNFNPKRLKQCRNGEVKE